MSTATEKFNLTVQQMVEEKTLSLDALVRVNQLKDLVTQQETDLVTKTTRIATLEVKIATLQAEADTRNEELKALKAREASVVAREAVLHEAAKREAVAVATSAAYRDSMAIVFAPNAMRERVVAMAGNSVPGPNGTMMYTNNNEDRSVTRTEGYDQPQTAGLDQRDSSGKKTSL